MQMVKRPWNAMCKMLTIFKKKWKMKDAGQHENILRRRLHGMCNVVDKLSLHSAVIAHFRRVSW